MRPTPPEVRKKQRSIHARLLGVLFDGKWHNPHELSARFGFSYARRIRELRELGWCIEGKPGPNNGAWLWRLQKSVISPGRMPWEK